MVKTRILIQDVARAMNDELAGTVLARPTQNKTHVHECSDRETLDGIVTEFFA